MLKKFIIKLIGRKNIEFIRSRPFLTHGKYRPMIRELEEFSEIIDENYGKDPSLSLLLVRKFGHILDKGLHRLDVEKGHSRVIAGELGKNIKVAETEFKNEETIRWAKDKLEKYNELQTSGRIEPLEESQPDLKIVFDDLYNLFKHRRSNRSFLTKNVDDEILNKLASTVNWAASSCNKQPVMLFATNDPEAAKDCLKCCKGGTGFSEFIPAFISFTADMRGYYLPDEAYLPSIDVALGAQNFLLATETLGLGGCCMSWALKDQNEEAQLRKLLSIPDYVQIIFNVVIGYPSKRAVPPTRKDLSNTLFIRK